MNLTRPETLFLCAILAMRDQRNTFNARDNSPWTIFVGVRKTGNGRVHRALNYSLKPSTKHTEELKCLSLSSVREFMIQCSASIDISKKKTLINKPKISAGRAGYARRLHLAVTLGGLTTRHERLARCHVRL